jgi:conjugative transfer signal peptidase TraF
MILHRKLVPLLLGGASGFVILASLGHQVGIRVNLTGSIPPGLYRVVDRPVIRGSVVLVCLPKASADFGRMRGYIPAGSCDDGSAPVGKDVVAIVGDTIQVDDRGVGVNGRVVPNSAPLERDSKGRSLPRLRTSGHVVQSDEVWLVSSYSGRSYDSRYYGGVPTSRLVAPIEPLLTAR